MNRETPPADQAGLIVVAARSGGICEICGHGRATIWHPRKDPAPASAGMTTEESQIASWDPVNGLYLCHQCDCKLTDDTVDAYYLVGWRVRHDQDPAQVPVVIRHNAADSGLYQLTSLGDYVPISLDVPESVIYGDTAKAS